MTTAGTLHSGEAAGNAGKRVPGHRCRRPREHDQIVSSRPADLRQPLSRSACSFSEDLSSDARLEYSGMLPIIRL
jgi:hypothetical protein